MFSNKLKLFRDETTAWYDFVSVAWAIGLVIAPFASSIFKDKLYLLIFVVAMVLITVLIIWWTSFKWRAVVDRGRLYYGFRRLEKTMIYTIDKRSSSKCSLQYIDKIQATVDQRMLYPIRYKWSGGGLESMPRVKDPQQELVGVIKRNGSTGPYVTDEQRSRDDVWHYYFIAFSPPVPANHKAMTIDYTQEFNAKKGLKPLPFMSCLVIGDLNKLTMEARLPTKPKTVTVCRFKPGSPKADKERDGMDLIDQADNPVIRYIEPKPKNGYRYQVEWTT